MLVLSEEEKADIDQIVSLFRKPFSGVSDMTVDERGNIYLCGITTNPSFPITENAYNTAYQGEKDIFVMKVSPDLSSILYSTFIGGSGNDIANAITVDSKGCVYVGGYTDSKNFPFSSGHFFPLELPTSYPFICHLNATGSQLKYSSSYEDIPYSYITDIVLDENEDLYATGNIAIEYNKEMGLFLMKLYPVCDYDIIFTSIQKCRLVFPHVVVDLIGNSYIASYTWDYTNPVTSDAFQKEKQLPNHAQSGYIMKLDTLGEEILYATYLGGTNRDWLHSVVVDAEQCVYVTGKTHSRDFPVTPHAYNSEANNDTESFFTIINTSEVGHAQIVASSYLGGSGFDEGISIGIDDKGYVYIAGITNSLDYPTTPTAFDEIYEEDSKQPGQFDVFVSIFNSTGSTLLYSTYLGGSDDDLIDTMYIDSQNCVYLQGITKSIDFLSQKEIESSSEQEFIVKLKPNITD
jgi:hypothetical protein